MFTVLDLFSGIGGFALATEWAGGRTLAFCELAAYPSRVLQARWPSIPNLKDVTRLCRPHDHQPDSDGTDARSACIPTAGFIAAHGVPDVIAGGVPCQPASLVGKRRGTADARWLWPDTLRIIGELRPRFCLLENPRALLSLENGDAFRGVLATFARLGYDVQWDVVSAAALGAGHRRDRLWILASNADLERRTGERLLWTPQWKKDSQTRRTVEETRGVPPAAHPDRPRLEGHARHGTPDGGAEARRHAAPENLRERTITGPLWYHQSGIQPVVDGLPGGLVKDQLTAIGNSLVPQVALVWLRAIAQHHETENRNQTRPD